MATISLSTQTLSITYNKFDDTFTGSELVYVIFRNGHNTVFDEINVSGDSVFDFIINPDFFLTEIVTSNVPAIGDYSYIITILGLITGATKTMTINLKVIDSDLTPPSEFVYKPKYFILRDKYRLDILEFVSPNTTITPKEINGTIEWSYQNKTDLFDPIIASNLELSLEDGQDVGLTDLYSEEEKQFKVELRIENEIKFLGFIKPDGMFEDYVTDRWFLTIQCIDGLSTLKNISFSNSNGVIFSGKRSLLSVVIDCLNKTSLSLPININCKVFYEGFDGFQDILDNTIINTERYFQNADEPMDCETVLKSLLNVFNCTLIQQDGEWWIYRSIDMIEETLFSRYIDGLFDSNFEYSPNKIIGSHIDGFENFHCNRNQKKSIGASVQAYKISYQYGASNSVFRNPELKLDGSGLNIDGWTVHNTDGLVSRNESGYGIQSKSIDEFPPPLLLTLNQSIDIQIGATFSLSINFSNESSNFESTFGLKFAVGIGDMWLQENGEWSTTFGTIYIANSDGTMTDNGMGVPPTYIYKGRGQATYTAQIKAPKSGLLSIVILRDIPPYDFIIMSDDGIFRINSIHLSGTNNGDIKGIDYTAQRTTRTSTVTKADKTVYNGDSVSDLFVGTIYKDDGDTPTEKWYRQGRTEAKELLSINAEDNLRLSPRPMIIFEGDVYGFIPYLSVVSINNFDGKKFQFLNWSYILDKNIMRTSLKEYSDAYLDDFVVDVRYNFGSPTKTTIIA